MDLKNPIAQLENSKKSLRSKMNKAEDRILGLRYTIQDQEWVIKEHEKQNKKGNEHIGNMGYHEKKSFRL